jgi:phage/plasmid-associated DNA primase
MKDATKRFKRENDLQAQFLEECCERPQDELFECKEYKELSSELTDAFNKWARGHKDWSQKALATEWRRSGLIEAGTQGYPKRESKGVYWYGVKLV